MADTLPMLSLLDQIRKRPGMFLGSKSLTGLYHFIHGYGAGYRDACRDNNFKNISDEIIPREFHDWCAYRNHFPESTSGWRNMICSVTESEELAFDYFFQLLDEYVSREPRKVARVSNLKKTYTMIQGDSQQECEYPSSIALVTYTDDPGFFAESEIEGKTFPNEGFFRCLERFESSLRINRDCLTIIDEKLFLQLSKTMK